MMKFEETIKKAKVELSQAIYLSECSESKGIRTINSNKADFLSSLIYLAEIGIGRNVPEIINRQKAEIERLQKEKDFEQYEKTRLRLLFKGEYDNNKKVKSEAIKEFAERLKEEATVDDDSTWWVANIDIDNLVKEMTEGKE